jgi:hypothetical protein
MLAMTARVSAEYRHVSNHSPQGAYRAPSAVPVDAAFLPTIGRGISRAASCYRHVREGSDCGQLDAINLRPRFVCGPRLRYLSRASECRWSPPHVHGTLPPPKMKRLFHHTATAPTPQHHHTTGGKTWPVSQPIYDRSMRDPEGFWGEAAEALHWDRRWDRVLDDSKVTPRRPSIAGSAAASSTPATTPSTAMSTTVAAIRRPSSTTAR